MSILTFVLLGACGGEDPNTTVRGQSSGSIEGTNGIHTLQTTPRGWIHQGPVTPATHNPVSSGSGLLHSTPSGVGLIHNGPTGSSVPTGDGGGSSNCSAACQKLVSCNVFDASGIGECIVQCADQSASTVNCVINTRCSAISGCF